MIINEKSIIRRLRESHSGIYDKLEKNKYLQKIQNLLQDDVSLQMNNQCDKSDSQHSLLREVIGGQLKQIMTEIKVEKLKLKRVRQEEVYSQYAENIANKILELNEKINKLKEFYLYSKYLKKSTTELQNDIQKYFEFQKKEPTIKEDLQAYLNNPHVSDIIFKEYLKTYNVNIFTSDVITHYFELNQKRLLKQSENLIFQPERIPELCLLERKNIVFKQLYDINEKYSDLLNQTKGSYVNCLIELLAKLEQGEEAAQFQAEAQNETRNKKTDTFQQYNTLINEKLQSLNFLINKMSLLDTNHKQNPQNLQKPFIVNQYQQNFTLLTKYLEIKSRNLLNTKQKNQKYKKFLVSIFANETRSQKQSLAELFQENLIVDPLGQGIQNQQQVDPQKFQFLENKIIKTQSLLMLNKLFSALNVFSYIFQQINPSSQRQSDYIFKSLIKYIETDFQGEFIKQQRSTTSTNLVSKKSLRNCFHSPGHKSHYNAFIETDYFGNWVLLSGNKKLLYPSAIFGMMEILHYMTQVASLLHEKQLYSSEIMLQILSLKAQQISKIGEVILNIYNIIKSKQVSSYSILKCYLITNLTGLIGFQLEWLEKFDLSREQNQMFKNQLDELQTSKLNHFKEDSEIDFQKIYLEEKQRIANEMSKAKVDKFLTFYADKAKKADFLSQIIYEMDANYEVYPILQCLLKCEQYHNNTFYFYDNTQFYETVLYEIIQMRNHLKLDHYYTLPRLHEVFGFFTTKVPSFTDILSELSKLSINRIKVQQLLMFFKTQLKLKRNVFRSELHWLSYKSFVENGKDNSFRDFVQQQGSEIFSLSEEPLEYFLTNIKDFIRKVNLFQQQIQKFKYFEDLLGKMNLSKTKICNLDTYLNILTNSQLDQLTKVLSYFNPILKILKNQNPSEQLFADLKTIVQRKNKIRFEDITRNTELLEEKQKLGEYLFYHKSFGFELIYNDCFDIFVQQSRKSYTYEEESHTLKMVINRQRPDIIKQFDEILSKEKRDIHLVLSFYRHLMIVSLLLVKDEILDENDKQVISDLLGHFSFPINVIAEIKTLIEIFQTDWQYDNTGGQIYVLLKIKKFLRRLGNLIDSKQSIDSYIVFNNNKTIQSICLIAKLTIYTQKKILQKIQSVHQEIAIKDVNDSKKKQKQLDALKNKFLAYFLNLLKKRLNQFENQRKSSSLTLIQIENNEKFSGLGLNNFMTIEDGLYQVQVLLLYKILALNELKSEVFKKKQQLLLFDRLSGYQIKEDQQVSSTSNIRTTEIMRRNERKFPKKGVFSPVRFPQISKNNIMQNIQKRVGIQMIKESMDLRKGISKLELQQKKMRDQISWQTSKLEHNVVKKIHAFIAESNIDQQQSYINFKYTVNLETIKGMQNVIKEQTELAYKATKFDQHIRRDLQNNHQKTTQEIEYQKKSKQEANDFFLTNPKESGGSQQDAFSLLGTQNSRMLNTNIDSIFNHLKKIKVFAAWKKINRNMDLANQQWLNFNKNVARILHNQENMKKVEIINAKRGQCFKQSILCSLLKEENKILSEKIRQSKMESLNKTIQKYRTKLIGENESERAM